MSKELWKGIYPALLTPFKENGDIDFDMFSKNLSAQLEGGVHGLILAGSLGEASTLTTQEKYDLLSYTVKFVSGKDIPVILGIAEQATAEAIKIAQKAETLGANGLMILPPMRYKADDRETVVFFTTIANSVQLPIMVYNNPVDYGNLVTLDMFEQLAAVPNIQAVKESTRDLTNITRMINRFGNRFKILGGVDTITTEALLMGADGIVAGLVDAYPRETVAIYDYIKAGEVEKALEIFRWFLPLLELDIRPKLVQYIKLAATKEGISNEYVRAPRLPLVGEERERILKIIADSEVSRPNLEVNA
ncbi:dihydrodipicolinate synthase family protein [Olivibacter ginsenosidimutans]|uniref:Dihydrodipicolinate synthase family protein n=1 Tax=Olivibacter ginsenosidimutans TaxID=1176537 RepID=A0ABP9C3P4_9SPHI